MNPSEIGKEHVKQFNALFEERILDNVVALTKPLIFKNIKLSFERIEIRKPFLVVNNKTKKLLPFESRLQDLSYAGKCFLKIKLSVGDTVLIESFKAAGLFPIMYKSKLCHLTGCDDETLTKYHEDYTEPGGYFIINGYERLLRFHIATKRNIPLIVHKKPLDASYSSIACLIRSVGDDEIGQIYELLHRMNESIELKFFSTRKVYRIAVVLILRALKNTTDEEICHLLGNNPRVLVLLHNAKSLNAFSQEEAINYLGSRLKYAYYTYDAMEAGNTFLDDLLPHLSSRKDKFNFLIFSLKKLLNCIDGVIMPEDRDLMDNQELFTETQLIALCVREKLEEIKRFLNNRLIKLIKAQNKKKSLSVSENENSSASNQTESNVASTNINDYENFNNFGKESFDQITKIVNKADYSMDTKLIKLLGSGNITTSSCSDILQTTGFSIFAERINFWRFASHFQSVSRGSFFNELKVTTVRKLKPEAFGFICPINTPDGAPCGLLNHLTSNCEISNSKYNLSDISILFEFGLNPDVYAFNTMVFYNGKIIGSVDTPKEFVDFLRVYKCKEGINIEVVYEHGEKMMGVVYICDELSRFSRKIWNKRFNKEEYIGIKEQIYLDIELEKPSTEDVYYPHNDFMYREVDNLNMFSLLGSCISFVGHNPSPRNMYQCQMAKQAMGIPCYNHHYRTDNKLYATNYLQHPLIKSVASETLADYPLGINCIVAVLAYTAFDMEDALILNKASVEKGMFGGFIYTTFKQELEKNSSFNYLPAVGDRFTSKDVLIKYEADGVEKICKYENSEDGVVDQVMLIDNGKPFVSIKFRHLRHPIVGDKFCSRYGQKGVCSILWPEEDMPFTESGYKPDIIINPHAFPSRMTIGMLLESMGGKIGSVKGKTLDATPFKKMTYFSENDKDIDVNDERVNIGKELRESGFNYYGNEPMYSGVYGTDFRTDVFIGVVYYQRLRHMVSDKFQVRTSGPIVAETHQPVGGRSNKGGIRFGEMERDALIAHGTSVLLNDRLMKCSDVTKFILCKKCKSILFTQNNLTCPCGGDSFKKIEMPFVYKYLCCEFLSMNLKVEME